MWSKNKKTEMSKDKKNKSKLLECLAIECSKILSKNNQINFFLQVGV